MDDNRKLVTSALFVQVQKSFRSALLSAEHGLPGDTNTVLRSATEAAIALHALEADPAFLPRLIGRHFSDQASLARYIAGNPVYRRELDAAAIRRLDATGQGADARPHGFDSKPDRMQREQVAAKHCPDLYVLLYRSLSTYGTHRNMARLDEQLRIDEHGQILGLNPGPTTRGLNFTLKAACMILLYAARVFANVLERPGFEDRLRFQLRRFGRLADEASGCVPPQVGLPWHPAHRSLVPRRSAG